MRLPDVGLSQRTRYIRDRAKHLGFTLERSTCRGKSWSLDKPGRRCEFRNLQELEAFLDEEDAAKARKAT